MRHNLTYLGQCPTQSGDGAEVHGDCKGADEGKQEEDKECRDLTSEVCHEIQGQIEDNRRDDFVRKIAKHGGDSLRERVIKCVLGVFLHDGSLCVKC